MFFNSSQIENKMQDHKNNENLGARLAEIGNQKVPEWVPVDFTFLLYVTGR